MATTTTTWTFGEVEDRGGFLPVVEATAMATVAGREFSSRHTLTVIHGPWTAEEGATPLWEVRDTCDNRPCNGQYHVIPA